MPRNYQNQEKIDRDFGWLNDESKNRVKYESILSNAYQDITKEVGIVFPPTYKLVKAESSVSGFEIALLCSSAEEIVYYIKCEVWEDIILAAKPVTQVLLWRTGLVRHIHATSSLAQNIFRNYLLDRYNLIASDSCQTREGRDFWVRQLGYALSFGEYVYRFHRITCDLKRLTDDRKIVSNEYDIWGDEEDYENVLAIISKEEITLD